MDIEKALALTSSKDLLAAAKEAEARNCERGVIQALYKKCYEAAAKGR